MKTLRDVMDKDCRLVIGLMSGTSCDGIDAVLTEIRGSGIHTRLRELCFCFTPYTEEIRSRILKVANGNTDSTDELCQLNFALGHLFAEATLALIRKAGIAPADVDIVGSHGQTIWHIPTDRQFLGYLGKSTYQIGEASLIAEAVGCPVVSDFRVRDVAAGGLGAPLVPYTEFILYRRDDENIALQNIGGIGNITFIDSSASLDDVYAFDTGPGNMLIDAVVKHVTEGRQSYDKDGLLASGGKIDEGLLVLLLDDEYYSRPLPKTTGREKYDSAFVSRITDYCRQHSVADLDMVRTVTRLTAETIRLAVDRFATARPDVLIVGGGGASNPVIMKDLAECLPDIRVLRNEDIGYSSDSKEAVAFALLANDAVSGCTNNAPGATGARHTVVMGKISQ